ncbi:MAG: hypothetical protein JNM00_10525 [Flavobacteriales bacterium]|nr:hypothetical protein [Flavobacteriales bacterium]
MWLRLLLGLCLLTGTGILPASAQIHAIKLNSTFVLHNRAMGGIGYEFAPDSARFTYGLNLEVGQYRSVEAVSGSSSFVSRSLVGVGLVPEVRQYLPWFKREKPLGAFITGFGRCRLLRDEQTSGVHATPQGYQLEGTSTSVDRSVTVDAGLGIGFKTGTRPSGLQVEAVVGTGWSYDTGRSFEQGSQYFRIDLFLCGLFSRKTAAEDFVW